MHHFILLAIIIMSKVISHFGIGCLQCWTGNFAHNEKKKHIVGHKVVNAVWKMTVYYWKMYTLDK